MASSNLFFDDIRNKPEVIDPPQNEDLTDIGESVNDPAQTALKPNLTVSSSVRELLECPVCLNAMYPPIHQVCSMPLFPILDNLMKLYSGGILIRFLPLISPLQLRFPACMLVITLAFSFVAVFKWSHIMFWLQAQGSKSMPHLQT